MAGGRAAKPLFDLIPNRAGDPGKRPPAPPGIDRPAAPAAAPSTSSTSPSSVAPRIEVMGRDRSSRAAAGPGNASAPQAEGSSAPVAFSLNQIYLGAGILVVVIIVLSIVVWSAAYQSGRRSGTADLARLSTTPPPDVVEPDVRGAPRPGASGATPPGTGNAATPGRVGNVQMQPAPRTTPRPGGAGGGGSGGAGGATSGNPSRIEGIPPAPALTPAPGGQGAIIAAVGPLATDPREPGLNYLALATLPRADAEAAIAFLAQNGLQVIGVPVDRARAATNNPGPARLYALPGLSRDEFRGPAKEAMERAVVRLGAVWQREHRGSSNFARPGWEKFQP